MGGVGRAEGTEKELGTEEGQVVLDGENLGLCLKMALGGHLQRPSGDPEGSVLNPLELEDSRVGRVGEPDGGGIGEKGADEGLVGEENGAGVLAPVATSEPFEEAESILGFVYKVGDMGGKGEVGVERDTQHPGGSVEREMGAYEGEGGVEVGLVGVRGE